MKRIPPLLVIAALAFLACGRTEPYRWRLAEVDAGIDAGVDAGSDAGPCLEPGCSDGEREGFLDGCRYPAIAGCSGGFSLPGVLGAGSHCERRSGDDSSNPTGAGCSVEDLCALGWHLCRSAEDVSRSSPDGCAAVAPLPLFFVTAQSGPGCGICATGTSTACTGDSCQQGCLQTAVMANDVFGCGGLGAAPQPGSCAPLNRFGHNLCGSLGSPWVCGSNGETEAHAVVKGSAAKGGALCCRD